MKTKEHTINRFEKNIRIILLNFIKILIDQIILID